MIIVGILLIGFLYFKSKYNGFINLDEDVKKGWSEVQTQYQRRADVFLSQMEVVQGAASNEKEILIGITKARSGITEAKEKMQGAETPAQLDQYLQQAQQAALSIKVQVEAYPQIKSTDAFLKFQDEISGTENRISTARSDYNTIVTAFNKAVRTFPNNLIAGMFNFTEKKQFEANAGSENRPELTF